MSTPVPVSLDEHIRRLTERYIFDETPSGLLTVAGERADAPAVPLTGPPEREYSRRSYFIQDPFPVEPLNAVLVNRQTAQDLIEWGMRGVVESVGVPAGLFTGVTNAATTTPASTPTAETMVESMRALRAMMPEQEFRREVMGEWHPPEPQAPLFDERELARAAFRAAIDTGPVVRPPSWITTSIDVGPPPAEDTLVVDFDQVRQRGATIVGVDVAQEGSADRTVEADMSIDADGAITVHGMRERQALRERTPNHVPDELAHRALLDELRVVHNGFAAIYARQFGHPLSDDELDFMEQLRVDLQRACPDEFIAATAVLDYLEKYDNWRYPLYAINVSDGQITGAQTVLDENGVATENVSIEFRVADAGGGPNRNGDVFDVNALRDLTRQQYLTHEMRQSTDAFWRCVELRNGLAERLEAFGDGVVEATRAQAEAATTTEERQRLDRRLATFERDRRPSRLPILLHLVERGDMQELNMEEVRLWTGSARSDASPEGLAFSRSQSISPPPLYPGVQKAAWSSDEVAARQRNPAQRSDQVENLLTRLREILVARGLEPDVLKYTLNASSPIVNNCRVFVFRVLQTVAGDLVEVLCVRILQKINDRGASDWGYQVTEGNNRRISRPLRPYVSQEALYRERQLQQRQARASGAAQTDAEARRREQEAADRAAQERVAAARARAAARNQPPPPISIQPELPRPEDFRPGLDL